MVSSEIKEPQKNLPRALIGGTLTVVGIYMLANAAYFRVLAPAEVAGSTRVAAEMMRKLFGNEGAGAVAIAAMISIFAALNGSILSGARVPYAAARDGYFFRSMARVHPQHHTPGMAIILLNLWACFLVLSGKYDDLFNLVIFASWILYGMTAAAVLVLRKKRPELVRPYRTLGYPVVPLLFVVGAGILLFSTAFERPRDGPADHRSGAQAEEQDGEHAVPRWAGAVLDDEVDDEVAAEGAEHEHLAVGEVDQLEHAVDQRVTQGDQRVEGTAGEPEDQEVQEVLHGVHPL